VPVPFSSSNRVGVTIAKTQSLAARMTNQTYLIVATTISAQNTSDKM
jgi:hypothetical protein